MERLGKEAEETQAVCSLALDSKVREVREKRWLLYLFSVYLLLFLNPPGHWCGSGGQLGEELTGRHLLQLALTQLCTCSVG